MSTGRNSGSAQRWQVDFSHALFNRSGKYRIGKEIIRSNSDLIDNVWYWRWRASRTPSGPLARVLGKAEQVERNFRVRRDEAGSTGRGPARRWLHLDPLTLCFRPAASGDVVICHDLGPLSHPELFAPEVGVAYGFAYRSLVSSGARVVFVSRDTAARYADRYGEPRDAHVIYPPITVGPKSENARQPRGIGERYLLTVGAIGARKNQAMCIRAFEESGLVKEGYQYVMCGAREPGHEVALNLARRTAGVRVLSFVTNEELGWLYRNAAGFVLASNLEGFGMPVAEAMVHDLVPIVSRGGVLEEVAGDAAVVVDPTDHTDIAEAFRAVSSMGDGDKARRRSQMKAQLTQFTPEAFNSHWRAVLS